MPIFTIILLCLTIGAWGWYTALCYLESLHMFQQNIYNTGRYFGWMGGHLRKVLPLEDFAPYLGIILMFVMPNVVGVYLGFGIIIAIYVVLAVLRIVLSRRTFVKKPLVFTPRVIRLVITSSILYVLMLIAAWTISFLVTGEFVTFLILIIIFNFLNYFVVWVANAINAPIEATIRKRFVDDAKRKIEQMPSLRVVGITGSYGKTTSKNIVNHLLSAKYYSLMTPASFNTPMGLTITIREYLKPIHEVFIAEMGAYKLGEIKELCDIAHPRYGILTSIGPQHLDTFKTIENVQKTKFELIESLPADGVAFLNMDDKMIADYQIQNTCRVVTLGIESTDVDYRGENIRFDKHGMTFDIRDRKGLIYHFRTKLMGTHNVANFLAAFALGIELGVEPEAMQRAVGTMPAVEHRLELKRQGDITIIDDAFNANPVGTKMALEVLAQMDGKRIVITPGMIELGEQQYELNKAYGTYMKDTTDFVILVGEKQTQPIQDGLKEAGFPEEQIYVARDLQDALAKMRAEIEVNSYVLIANDLPDSYNE